MASTDQQKKLWLRSLSNRNEYYECFKQIIVHEENTETKDNFVLTTGCEACELGKAYDDRKAEQLAALWDELWAYDEVADDLLVAETSLSDMGIMTEESPQDLQVSVWAARRRAFSKSQVAWGGSSAQGPTAWRGYCIKNYTLEGTASERICPEHVIRWADTVLTAVELSPALKSVITNMTTASSELTPRLKRPKQSIDKGVATKQTIDAWREFTKQETGMRDLVLGHWHTWYIFSILSSTESGGLLAASAAECVTTYADYVDVTDGGNLGSAQDHLKLALDGMSSDFIVSSPGARAAIWTATSVIRYRALLARDITPWRTSLPEPGPPVSRIELVKALPDPLELVNLRMLDGSMLASYLATLAGTVSNERPRTRGVTMIGHRVCRLVRLATSNLFKYNDITDLQSDITSHEAMNTLAFATIVNGGRVAQHFLAAISRDADLVISCRCSSDMHQWAHDMAMGSCVWYALCPRYNMLQQVGLYYKECPNELFAGLPILVTNASMGNVGSALSNDQGTFDKNWNLDSNPPTLASQFGIRQEGPLIETALRVTTRTLPMHDTKGTLDYCLSLINAEPRWSQSDYDDIAGTGSVLLQLIHDLALHYQVMDSSDLKRLISAMTEYISLTVEACQEQMEGGTSSYISNEFCLRQARLYLEFYELVSEMHSRQEQALECRRFAVGAMSLLFDGWKYGGYVGITRYPGLS